MLAPVELPRPRTWRALVERALDEDLGPGDVTSALVVPADAVAPGVIEARQELVVCGLEVARAVFAALESRLAFEPAAADGEEVAAGSVLARVRGPLRALLAGERTALNFLQRMCGIATFTRRYVEAVAGTGAEIVDTRKTLPGWRTLDKYATAVGGARNHRAGLYDGILLKDNHVAFAGGVVPAVKAALAAAPAGLRVQVEVESEEDAQAAVDAGADFLLLDNCGIALLRRIAQRLRGSALLEASGGVNLANVRAVAETGVHRISIGALTHSAPAADIALELTLAQGGRRPTRSPQGREAAAQRGEAERSASPRETEASEGGPLHGGVPK
ncbi:MAG: carboxylating nicotinate-nucleotide diphosphorylase [Deltaproteobacteria bacterium]|nr:MAG: carboxylating nicotinate-nucleotide diphosphorylase [Deltaproteobacteria bacterium]